MKNKQKGFTLIELLVVIAIIGILSSVVLASLNTARGKGADAAATEDLNNIRAQAELVYSGPTQSYTGVCTNPGDPNVIQGITAAAKAEGLTWSGLGTVPGTNLITVGCNSANNTWVAWVNLAKGTNGATTFCVDNTGKAVSETTAPSSINVTACW
jgi:prepilin-type N-terminal cleavage/methylation domain-containing protein